MDPHPDADVAAVAALFADRARAAMLDALMDGRPRPAGELARSAGIAASTASEHLSRLLDGGLVTYEPDGRERRYRIASPAVAAAIEVLARLAPQVPARSLRVADRNEALRRARTCYDHLAGRLGVAVTEALVVRGILDRGDGAYALTDKGERVLDRIGVDVVAARTRSRAFARECLDWSERRPHLAGALGAAVAAAFLEARWVRRRPNDRALVITDAGAAALRRELGVSV
jgi:DNA-binding transcriptional ArsR family regulator